MSWTIERGGQTQYGVIEYQLRDRDDAKVIADAVAGMYEAAWVRARIPRVFGYTPAPSEVEKSLIHETFTATRDGVTCSFTCIDHYGKAGLELGALDAATKASIAEAFWTLLLADPTDLADFRTRVFHDGAGIWLEYFCEAGTVGCDEFEA